MNIFILGEEEEEEQQQSCRLYTTFQNLVPCSTPPHFHGAAKVEAGIATTRALPLREPSLGTKARDERDGNAIHLLVIQLGHRRLVAPDRPPLMMLIIVSNLGRRMDTHSIRSKKPFYVYFRILHAYTIIYLKYRVYCYWSA